MRLKKCANPKCEIKEPQPIANFGKHTSTHDGFRSRCRACSKLQRPSKEKMAEYTQRRREKDPLLSKKSRLKYSFGITLERFNEMLAAQNYVCAVCRLPETHKYKNTGIVQSLSVDHCHKTGRVRALLCHGCNAALGLLKECPLTIAQLAAYVQLHRKG